MHNKTYNHLIKFLDENNAKYRLIDHIPEGRTDIISPIRGNDIEDAAKCIIVAIKLHRKEIRYILSVVPGNAKVDMDVLKRLFKGSYASFADKATAEKLGGCVSGTILPFSFSDELILVVDPKLLNAKELFFNAARLDQSVALKTEDYKRLAKARYEAIAKYDTDATRTTESIDSQEIRRRHTGSHVMTFATKMTFPDIDLKLGVGPWTETEFYQDFDFGDRKVSDSDFKAIEKKMRWIVNKNFKIEKKLFSEKEARKIWAHDPYKQELIDGIVEKGEQISAYDFLDPSGKVVYRDICAGPHLDSTGQLGVFKLIRIAGSYWRGDETRPMLTRIYGVAFATEAELHEYEHLLEEAARRDHRKLGKELELFTFDEEVGPGLPLWLPNGAVIVEQLEKLAKETEDRFGYKRVRSPHIAKEKLYLRSGHLPYYAASMFPPMELDNEKYYLKAMNCPHHHKIYAALPKSYRDLPLRLAEYGHCYRFEDSGALFGLMRVRSLCMNDAHIYCTEEQFESEFQKVIEMYLYYFKIFGIEKYQMRFSKHAKEGLGKKYVNEPKLWLKTEAQVRDALTKMDVPFVEVADEAAFYGPKIDVQIWSVIGREFTLATNQLDFAVPARFDLKFIDRDGSEKVPLCIHRAPLSTHERMIGFLIEHYAGAFPAWLAPVQAAILPVASAHEKYAEALLRDIKELNGRAEMYNAEETLGKRIRAAQMKKIPYSVIVGENEVKSNLVTVRKYGQEKDETMDKAEFLKLLQERPR